ncbi:tetratricopeptide repeat protein [Alteromonas pelagimontana]|uniref:tetratricopeptide repeat protein n=1 Tax=Alteromonas pelagimontana TaxID=1858656 RepID=UPI000950002A|nr:hypothetical protein [Alteromonas pelagimontana]
MRGLCLALLALLLVSADSGRQNQQLIQNAQAASYPAPLLWRAALQGSDSAQQLLTGYAQSNGDEYWLNKLVALGNADAAWALYQMVSDDDKSTTLMRLAARGEVPEAQMKYALATDDPEKREAWLVRAAEQDYLPAQAALADWYLLHSQPDKARPWLKKTAKDYAQSAFQYGRLLWDEGSKKESEGYLEQAAQQGHELAQKLTKVLALYQPVTVNQIKLQQWPSDQLCQQRIQIFATSLSTIERAHDIKKRFTHDKRLSSLPICMLDPVWLKKDVLKCDDSWQQSGRLGCDIRPLAAAVKKQSFTHAVIVADLGKANVNNGVMFLDLTDAYSVFVHELAHFAGFVDEYALSEPMAKRYCGKIPAPNLIFDGVLTYAPLATLENWQSLEPDLSIWPAKSCDGTGERAYKPSDKITFLEHHDSGEIPPIYLQLWQQQLAEPTAQRPIFMNLFQSFHKHGQTAQAGEWLAKYEAYNRSEPIVRGNENTLAEQPQADSQPPVIRE